MDDSAIRNYCTWARNELRDEVMRRCAIYDISEKPSAPADADAVAGRVLTDVEKRQRAELLRTVKGDGLDRTVERAAYTWFNRIAAIRFMEVNDRLPSHTRLLSANDGSFRPQALQEPLSVDIEGLDRAEVARLVQEGDDEATFRCLLLAQCHELSACMPDVFERVGAAMELLLPDGLLREGGVIERMVDGIPESDWAEGVEIVGWAYQYYNQERKDEYFASKRKATADDIAPATQLFTPEWIVRYLVENSLGRLWMLNFPDSRLKDSMEYYIDPGEDHEEDFLRIESPEDITFCDPCCGSGHILVYAFDLLARMYEERGYSRREIPRLVLERNLTGIEIDRRAGQLASFALTMKACEYDRRFLSRGVQPNVNVLEPVRFGEGELSGTDLLAEGHDLLDAFAHLDEVGSLYVPAEGDLSLVESAIEAKRDPADMFAARTVAELETMKSELKLLSRRFSVVVTNPPYLGNFNNWMGNWVKENYADVKSDVFAAFIFRNLSFAEPSGELGFMTPFVWMFISSYEKLRRRLISSCFITSLIQLEYSGFAGATVPICTFTLSNINAGRARGRFVRLANFPGPANQAPRALEAIHNHDCGWFYEAHQSDFASIPGSPIAYWASSAAVRAFKSFSPMSSIGYGCNGMTTGKNELFLRLWFEVSKTKIEAHASNRSDALQSGKTWFPYNKGGDFRKWYGNEEWVIDWYKDGEHVRSYGHLVPRSQNYMFKPAITWSKISSSKAAFRLKDAGQLFDVAGLSYFVNDESERAALIAFCNSSCAAYMLSFLAPTLNFEVGSICSLPIAPAVLANQDISLLASRNYEISKFDYNLSETAPEFIRHPLLPGHATHIQGGILISEMENALCKTLDRARNELRANEEKIDSIVNEIYDFGDGAPIEVDAGKLSCRKYIRSENVSSLISYAVGCMMGRYSLDVDGLVLADQGATLDDYLEKVPEPTFMPDEDGIIPLTDVEYFHDDATGLFVDFLKAAYGEETLEENLAFVAESLGGEGAPREVIRDYFRNQFFADHCKTYSVTGSGKRPIYWLFDSGKKGGFRALFYMHRYTPDLLARLRTDYVHPQQERYRNQIEHIDEVLPTADRREAARLKKERKKLSDQLAETNAYEEKVHHLADQMISIDLDDGVKHNYALFQDVLAKIK
jgi:type II restriction/modification system DNA methylase subunit YeeA